jgi:hypothetical protein
MAEPNNNGEVFSGFFEAVRSGFVLTDLHANQRGTLCGATAALEHEDR